MAAFPLQTTVFSRWHWMVAAALTGLLFTALAWRLDWSVALLAYSYLAVVLVPLAMVALAKQRLPGVVVLPSYLALGVAFGVDAVLHANYDNLLRSVAGMVVLAAAYLGLALTVGGLGAGDVRLAGLLGLALGWWSCSPERFSDGCSQQLFESRSGRPDASNATTRCRSAHSSQ